MYLVELSGYFAALQYLYEAIGKLIRDEQLGVQSV